MTRQAVTPQMRQAADRAANAAKAQNPGTYNGTGIAPGHTPDVGWGGQTAGPIIPFHKLANSYVGGATQAVPPRNHLFPGATFLGCYIMIDDLIRQAAAKTDAIAEALNAADPIKPPPNWAVPVRFDPEPPVERVATLARGVYRPISPMLRARFQAFGRWRLATHGHWLAAADMEELWDEPPDLLLREIREMREAAEGNWPNEASALFRPDRLSLFAGNDLSNDKIYLLWLDCQEEPELWVYDANGEGRYPDLAAYLTAYLGDD